WRSPVHSRLLAAPLCAALAVSLSNPAHAEEHQFSLDSVLVVAPRPDLASRWIRTPGFTSVLATSAGQPLHSGMVEALSRAPGLHVAGSGGPGAFATLSIRGSSAAQVSYFLDGVPLRWNEFGAINLNDLPFESLSRVEVFRGHVPASLGGTGMG